MRVPWIAVPNSREKEVVGWQDDPREGRVWRVRIAARPVDGKAKVVLRDTLAAQLGVAGSRVRLAKGASGRIKAFGIPGAWEGV